MCLSNEERKLIGCFNPINPNKKDEARQYAINDIYCDADEIALLSKLVEKECIFYDGNDFYWHLTDRGLKERNDYLSELPYPDKSHF